MSGLNPARVHQAPPLLGLIGNTPLLELQFEPEGQTIYAKCEFLNPSGSIKDRFASALIETAERDGVLGPDSIVLECTSGNTGIALAMVGAAKGYPVTILMSEGASLERRQLIKQLGAELILFKPEGGYRTGIELSRKMAEADKRYFLPRQFENPLNAEDHEHGTGQEILRQIPIPIGALVTGYGTGGTLAGVGKALKAKYPNVRIIAMEPAEAAMLAGEMPCCHWIEGIAGGFVPPLLRLAPLDGRVPVKSSAAMAMTRRLAREFGLLVGTSSGANVVAALQVGRTMPTGSAIVTILCDRAERYFSTRLFPQSVG